jgi:cytochrome c oxidase assembly protein subunit 15
VRTSAAAPSPWLATAALLWVCVQGAFGALTVTQKLQPMIVTVHLLGGVGLLALLVWLALRESPCLPVAPAARGLRLLAAVALCVTVLQIALGGWVSTNYAVLACSDFPRCQGAWVPPLDFEHAFTLWRDLGKTGTGEIIPFQALVTIHWVHRAFALVAAATVGILVWSAWRVAGLGRTARWLLAVLVLQLATGLSNVILNWPLVAAVLHSGGAALMVALLVVVNFRAAGARSR